MNTNSSQSIWSDVDEQFFALVSALFDAPFLWGASALLASYDAEPVTLVVAPGPSSSGTVASHPAAHPVRSAG